MKYAASELVLDGNGTVYHLGIAPENIASTILLVGDQDRVGLISSFFDQIEYRSQHREFVCHTGSYRGKRISALSTGIGTDNIDITINELDALFNIDLKLREDKDVLQRLKLIRIGTCGILQPEYPVHSYILSDSAYGLDNIAHFYPISFNENERLLERSLSKHLELPEPIKPYFVTANAHLVEALKSDKTVAGITVTSSGFYGPQGRSLRLGLKTNDLNERLTAFRGPSNERVMNFEMESSALFALAKGLGHDAVTICLGVANRPKMEFSRGYHNEMLELIQYVLDRV
jgi:uridine phosphorylase